MNLLNGKWKLATALFAFLLMTASSCYKEQQQAILETLCGDGIIQGIVVDEYGQPVPGVRLERQGSTQSAETDGEGFFQMEHVPAGDATLDLTKVVESGGNESAELVKDEIKVDAAVKVTVKPNGTVTIEIKIKIEIKVIPDCDCKPWCAIVGSTDLTTGVKGVTAGGGARPRGCPYPVTIQITDPAGNNFNPPQPPGRQNFEPAAPGKWSVSVTVCGQTKVCSIML